jgi:hypothetical protein
MLSRRVTDAAVSPVRQCGRRVAVVSTLASVGRSDRGCSSFGAVGHWLPMVLRAAFFLPLRHDHLKDRQFRYRTLLAA